MLRRNIHVGWGAREQALVVDSNAREETDRQTDRQTDRREESESDSRHLQCTPWPHTVVL